MIKMSRTLVAIGATLTAALALAGTVGAQTVCPVSPLNGENELDWPAPDGHWHQADCWRGPNWNEGYTIARGRAYATATGVDLQAYLFGGFGAISGRIHGWNGFNLLSTCSAVDVTANGTWGSIVHKTFAQCASVQEFRVTAVQ